MTGSVNYQVVGWFVSRANIGFLIPITIINGAAFVALVIAMWIAWTNGHIFHPSHPRPVAMAEYVDEQEQVPDEWSNKVAYNPTTSALQFSHNLFPRTNSSVWALGIGKILGNDVAANPKAIKAAVHDVEQNFVAGPSGSHQEDSAPTNDISEQDIAGPSNTLQTGMAGPSNTQ